MTEKAMQKAEEHALSKEQVDLIRKTVAQDCNDDELALFLHTATRTGLDPLLKQVYAIKRKGRLTIQTGIDGYRLIADRTGRYAPGKAPVFAYRDGKHVPYSATVTIRKMTRDGTWHEVEHTAFMEEYYPKEGYAGMWNKMPHVMLAKVAEVQALRKAFPGEFSGLYSDEEMDQAGPADKPKKWPVIEGVKPKRGNGQKKAKAEEPPKESPQQAQAQDAEYEELERRAEKRAKEIREGGESEGPGTGNVENPLGGWLPKKETIDHIDALLRMPCNKTVLKATTEWLYAPQHRNVADWARCVLKLHEQAKKAGEDPPQMPQELASAAIENLENE